MSAYIGEAHLATFWHFFGHEPSSSTQVVRRLHPVRTGYPVRLQLDFDQVFILEVVMVAE